MFEFPWQVNPSLQREYIIEIANLIAQVRGEVIDLYDETLGDTRLSLGMRAYECCRSRIISESNKGSYPWLDILTPNGRFTFSIDSVPVRFVRNEPSSLPSDKLIPSLETAQQMELFSESIEYSFVRWLYVIDTDFKHIADNMYFVGYSENGRIICQWDIPLEKPSVRLAVIEDEKPKPIELPKASISVKKPNEEITPNKAKKLNKDE